MSNKQKLLNYVLEKISSEERSNYDKIIPYSRYVYLEKDGVVWSLDYESGIKTLVNVKTDDDYFLEIGYFHEEYAGVKTEKGWNFIGKDGKFVSDKFFLGIHSFWDGYAHVKTDEGWTLMGTDGKLRIKKIFNK